MILNWRSMRWTTFSAWASRGRVRTGGQVQAHRQQSRPGPLAHRLHVCARSREDGIGIADKQKANPVVKFQVLVGATVRNRFDDIGASLATPQPDSHFRQLRRL